MVYFHNNWQTLTISGLWMSFLSKNYKSSNVRWVSACKGGDTFSNSSSSCVEFGCQCMKLLKCQHGLLQKLHLLPKSPSAPHPSNNLLQLITYRQESQDPKAATHCLEWSKYFGRNWSQTRLEPSSACSKFRSHITNWSLIFLN